MLRAAEALVSRSDSSAASVGSRASAEPAAPPDALPPASQPMQQGCVLHYLAEAASRDRATHVMGVVGPKGHLEEPCATKLVRKQHTWRHRLGAAMACIAGGGPY